MYCVDNCNMKKRWNWKVVVAVLVGTLVSLNCVKKKTDDTAPDTSNAPENIATRQDVLTNYADNIILPAYANFGLKLDSLVAASNNFTSKPDSANLSNLRMVWQKAYIEWQKVEMFDVGPAFDYNLRSYFNIFPTRVNQNAQGAGIEENINSGTANLDLPQLAATQGFPALDYLLFGLGNDQIIIAKYTSDANAIKRLAYVKKITDKMKSIFGIVNSEWNTTYRATFVGNTALDAGAPFSLLLNGIVRDYEKYIRSGKIGIPSGAMASSGGITYPDKVEAYYKKDISLTLAKTAQKAFVDLFHGVSVKNGAQGASLLSYLDALGAKDVQSGQMLSSFINEQFVATTNSLNLLTENLSQEVSTNDQAMKNVYNAMQKTTSIIKVDMVSAVSIIINYTDTDGD